MSSQWRNKRITLQRAIQAEDGVGGTITTWTDLGTVWASVEPIGGREALRAGQLLAEMDTRIIVRWSPLVEGLTAKDRIVRGTTIYNIVRPPADRRMGHKQVEIMCNSGINDG